MASWRNQQKLDQILRSLQEQITGGGNARDRDRSSSGNGGGKGGKGGGKGAGGVTPASPTSLEPCQCCGRSNHLKKDCRFRDRCCNYCGREGHLEAVCWEKLGGVASGNKQDHKPSPPAKPDPKTPKKEGTDPPWMCHKCHAVVPDLTLQKCPEDSCRMKRIMPEKNPEAPRPLIGKEARKIIESAAGVGEAVQDYLLKTIEQAKKHGFKEIQAMSENEILGKC